MPAERLEREAEVPRRLREGPWIGERLLAGEVGEHLALARAAQVELVEEGRNGLVVLVEQLQAVEQAVALLPVHRFGH